jgi:hypothetical protein
VDPLLLCVASTIEVSCFKEREGSKSTTAHFAISLQSYVPKTKIQFSGTSFRAALPLCLEVLSSDVLVSPHGPGPEPSPSSLSFMNGADRSAPTIPFRVIVTTRNSK